MLHDITFRFLIISLITLGFILFLLRNQKKNTQIKKIFIVIIYLAMWWVALELL